MKVTKGKFIYVICCELPIVAVLCIIAPLLTGSIDWKIFGIDFAIAYVLCVAIGLIVPLAKIGNWFTRVCKCDDSTYNMKHRLLANLIITFIYYLSVTITLTIVNYFLIPGMTWIIALKNVGIGFLPILASGYVASIICDELAYRIANKCDKNFIR